jgi:hypothetical protein
MSNLNEQQFSQAADVEAQARRRFNRKQESGFIGTGYNYANYPYRIGAMGTGGIGQMDNDYHQPNAEDEHSEDAGSTSGEMVAGTTGMGDGGTAASATGAAGGSPA